MNRSIFQICEWFNFNWFFRNFVFIILIYFFGFFHGGFVSCDDLIKIVYSGINVRHSPTLSSYRLYDSIEFFKNYILNTSESQFKFNIFKYLQLNGHRFIRTCVYDHYHLNLYLDNIYNVHYNLSLTHQPHKLNLFLNEFIKLKDTDLYNQERVQYILKDLKIYDLNVLRVYQDTIDDKEKFKNFILNNNQKCIFHFKNIINNQK